MVERFKRFFVPLIFVCVGKGGRRREGIEAGVSSTNTQLQTFTAIFFSQLVRLIILLFADGSKPN